MAGVGGVGSSAGSGLWSKYSCSMSTAVTRPGEVANATAQVRFSMNDYTKALS